MFFSPKVLIILTLVGTAALFGIVFLYPIFKFVPSAVMSQPTQGYLPFAPTFSNASSAFLSRPAGSGWNSQSFSATNATPFSAASQSQAEKKQTSQKRAEIKANIPSLAELQDKINAIFTSSSAPAVTSAAPEKAEAGELGILNWGPVADSEVSIDPAGASNLVEYLGYLNAHYRDVLFDYRRFDSALKNKNEALLLPFDLAEKAINDGNFSEVRNSFLIWKDFFETKGKFFASIKVTGDAVVLSKETIGFNKLILRMISMAFDVEKGSLSQQEFKNYFNNLKILAEKENKKFLGQTENISFSEKGNIFSKILNFFGLDDFAFAAFAGVPFGGMVETVIPCPCDQSFWVFLGPPVPPPNGLLVSLVAASTPPYYLYIKIEKIPRVGSWWLGLYAPVQIPCLASPDCGPIGFGNEPILLGTSQ